MTTRRDAAGEGCRIAAIVAYVCIKQKREVGVGKAAVVVRLENHLHGVLIVKNA